jgi:hypothetical protein
MTIFFLTNIHGGLLGYAGGAQDDELFCKKLRWWIVGNTSTPARF